MDKDQLEHNLAWGRFIDEHPEHRASVRHNPGLIHYNGTDGKLHYFQVWGGKVISVLVTPGWEPGENYPKWAPRTQ